MESGLLGSENRTMNRLRKMKALNDKILSNGNRDILSNGILITFLAMVVL